jgi:hypothetical protein
MDRNVERRCEMAEDELAIIATEDMLFPEIAFLGRERAIVIGSQGLGIRTKFGAEIGAYSGKGICIHPRRCGRTQVAGERFFKGPVAVVRRHGFLLP